jgi:adenylosuccinate synthase
MPGWKESTIGITAHEDLPDNAKQYLKRIEDLVDTPVDVISTGPDRSETIVKRHPFD